HAIHLVARVTKELDVLDRLRGRVARAKSDVDTADPLPPTDERAVARAVIAGHPVGIDSRSDVGPVCLTSLTTEAHVEAERLATVRRLLARDRVSDAVLPRPAEGWLANARKAATRAALGPRALLMFLALCEDGGGNVLESTLVPVGVDLIQRRAGTDHLRGHLSAIEPAACIAVQDAITQWRDDVVRSTRHVLDVRLARERAIAAPHEIAPRLVQQGLFDRRAAREGEILRAAASDAAAESSRRIRALEQAARVSIVAPRLALVLVSKFVDRR